MINIIETIYFEGTHPSIGYTDFNKIYVSTILDADEQKVIKLHERSHIWLNHQLRTEALRKKYGDDYNHTLANIASDLEIAYHMYDADIEQIMNRPRSILSDGIKKSDCLKFPACQYFEEFYEALLENSHKDLNSHDGEANKQQSDQQESQSGQSQENNERDRQKLIEEARAQKSDHDDHDEQEAKTKSAQNHLISHFKAPEPSLGSVIDKASRRYKRLKVKTYKRPSRHESDFIKKGYSTIAGIAHLTVYVDRSGSFCAQKTSTATKKIHDLLRKYRGKIKQDVIYFNDKLLSDDPINGRGGTNYEAVVDHIQKNPSELNIIITDDDVYAGPILKLQKTVIIPIGCKQTNIAKILNLEEVL